MTKPIRLYEATTPEIEARMNACADFLGEPAAGEMRKLLTTIAYLRACIANPPARIPGDSVKEVHQAQLHFAQIDREIDKWSRGEITIEELEKNLDKP